MAANNKNKDNDLGYWIGVIVLFCVGLWPISVGMIFWKFFGDKNKAKQKWDAASQQFRQGGANTAERVWNAAEQAVNKAEQELRKQSNTAKTKAQSAPGSNESKTAPGTKTAARTRKGTQGGIDLKRMKGGTGLIIPGAILTGVFGLSTMLASLEFIESVLMGYFFADELGGVIALAVFLVGGLIMLGTGLRWNGRKKRAKQYLGLIGTRKSVSITALAKTSGVSRRRVMDDLQEMLDRGVFPAGYLDQMHDLLVLSPDGIPDEEPVAKSQPVTDETQQKDKDLIAQIRAVNDAIPDPVMSAKIDRIEDITGKILEYQRTHPGKDSQLRSFLNYYLPTTLKILNSYAQLDAQGVEGENISAAKKRIEGMMDKVVEGFEQQLDKLFADSAMDISSDVAVLEQMLEKDGLSGGSGMTLGM